VESHEHDDTPVLITEASASLNDQRAERKRKYLTAMGIRVVLYIFAAIFHDPLWVALLLVGISIPLPWMAVLIANDRPPRKSEKVSRFRPGGREPKQIEHSGHQVIEG